MSSLGILTAAGSMEEGESVVTLGASDSLGEGCFWGFFWTANRDSDRIQTRQNMIQLKKQKEVYVESCIRKAS